jgi:SOS-response transcriptional repressor LexA
VLHRRQPLLTDLPDPIGALPNGSTRLWQRYWRDNPVNAWVGGNLTDSSAAAFQLLGGHFHCKFKVDADQLEVFGAMVQELVDYRLASYDLRRAAVLPPSNVIPLLPRAKPAVELPYFPNLKIACGHFKAGRADAEEFRVLPDAYGNLDPQRHFIARASGNSMNGGKHPILDGDYLLLELLSPTKAGSITGSVMAIERQDEDGGDNQYLLRVVTKNAEGGYLLRANNPDYPDMPATDSMRTLARLKQVLDPLDMVLGQSFDREDIPALFDEVFNVGRWNVGHVVLNDKKVHVLLVTLNKQGKAEEHRYLDRWIDDHTFHWQSQNSTSPAGKRGQEIIEHEQRGIQIHLFVREQKLSGGKAAPFVYHGKVRYQSHEGSSPMSVTFSL